VRAGIALVCRVFARIPYMRAKTETAETPLMKQYQAIKASHPDTILFFRLGDFYEMFGEDAKTASSALGLLLTARHGTPMCGIPYHSSRTYISRLLKAGHKIAICEQIEQGDGKGLFRREVVRVITPGTVIEDELLDAKTRNHLLCVEADIVGWALACVEVSTGDFWATQKLGDDDLRPLAALMARLSPSEILASPKTISILTEKKLLPQGVPLSASRYDTSNVQAPDSWPGRAIWQNKQLALKAALAAARYVGENEPRLSGSLAPVYSELSSCMQLDEAAVRTLELVSGAGGRTQTLWGVLDKTRTAMGSRLLREWILQPLAELPGIESRQQAVAELFENEAAREGLSAVLSEIADVERIASRACALSAAPRDAAGLKKSLSALPALSRWLESTGQPVQDVTTRFEPARPALEHLGALLDKALQDNPPPKLSDGGVIKPGYSAELDELRAFKSGSGEKLLEMEAREKASTQISSLKVGYNSIFGYYIEVTKTNLSKVPSSYIRKQTLVNAERFITQELKELESKILGAEEKTRRLESHLFNEVLKEIAAHAPELKIYSRCLSELDALLSLSEVALKNDYVRPEIDNSRDFVVEAGRHPVAELVLASGTFVPNNLEMREAQEQIIVLTGPNMSGKSVYLKQNALIAIMAQIGSFVPAKAAKLGVVDRIMTRIGSQDAMNRGESTFMVEMRETANILACATPRSLLLLDEVGRGTSTFDGISIAWAVLEHLHASGKGPKTLFATHYFELTELAERYKSISNFNIEVKEWVNAQGKTELLFLHKIAPGPADKSYGIHVAELAGLPQACILRARKILGSLEKKMDPSSEKRDTEPLLPLFGDGALIDEIRSCHPDKMTPIEALGLVSDWKKRTQ